ncbi:MULTISPECIES: hemerythrin domain-containing protein [Cupriavidus]|uniref:Hemerythrin domain-containing protein n=1 Tax=Cupriavidus oxalaticus TaxID=96344 RepID=A0A4P7L917_9BURK|nr:MULTISPECIES: hemerythrin domain-containing protein [Cupriavidus]MBF6991746.1 hemerythrin domain-containing protein [Cupriavidus sp. IK-TO18]QBY52284.1 hemerythrin domain-containing protein [Cupriavidus oxalaticus]TDF66125.1 hemerythrin domain-containing protein [Cupriavidus sp. L7L]
MDKSKIPADQAEALGALMDDHRAVKKLFKAFKDTEDRDEKESIALEACHQLTVHATIEEEIFYPALRGASDDIDDMLDEAQVEHQVAKDLIAAIEQDPAGDMLVASFTVLSEYVAHHIEEEEGELFKNVIREKINLRDVARALAARKEELMQETA